MHYLATLLLLFIFFHLGVMESVLHKLAITRTEISWAMALAILFSVVNVQIFRLRIRAEDDLPAREESGSSSAAPHVRICVNLGGCILPLFFILYLLDEHRAEPVAALLLVVLVSAVVYPLSRVEGRRGLVINLFGAVVSAALGGVLLGGEDYLVWAYMAAVLGTLIGGDLLHLTQLSRLKRAWRRGVFIGGAGLMDAIFLSGIFSMMAAEVVHQKQFLIVAHPEPVEQIAVQPAVTGAAPLAAHALVSEISPELSHSVP